MKLAKITVLALMALALLSSPGIILLAQECPTGQFYQQGSPPPASLYDLVTMDTEINGTYRIGFPNCTYPLQKDAIIAPRSPCCVCQQKAVWSAEEIVL